MHIKDQSLPTGVISIIRHRSTEPPHSGLYNDSFDPGTYLCRGCGKALFRATSKFNAGCGWPSFDTALASAVKEQTDEDGQRTEITCYRCNAHLGHVFGGEGFTPANRRFCVNSKSLDWVKDGGVLDTEEAIVAGGCFWGVEHHLGQLAGVLRTEVGYTGGHAVSPTYHEVCAGQTGHVEAVRVIYDPSQVDYESVLKHFFGIHDPTQTDGQGPDRGEQYHSVIFHYNDEQKHTAEQLIYQLERQGLRVATRLQPVSVFWPAETVHQGYYDKATCR